MRAVAWCLLLAAIIFAAVANRIDEHKFNAEEHAAISLNK